MLSWAQQVTRGSEGDLVELYCGNANFTIPLAANFRRVVATEVAKSSIEAARFNLDVRSWLLPPKLRLALPGQMFRINTQWKPELDGCMMIVYYKSSFSTPVSGDCWQCLSMS